ncbi:hypothetical protein [Pistricoccus aurantiacus]|uniref:hypothetical protein n=1 Tax=Pistricoccus aurantiacus TaxID=1883414 RepID=UPI0036411300
MAKKGPKEKQSRETWAYFRTAGPVTQITCHVQGDSVTIDDADPHQTRTEISYERASGKPKRISTMTSRDGAAGLDFQAYLMDNYRYLCGVDTNYLDLGDKRIAVTAIYHCPTSIQSGTKEIPIELLALYVVLEPQSGVNPELIGWHLALKHLKDPGDGGVVGMVVDSEAGRIPEFNSRTESFLEDCYLPPYVDLIYASADKKDCVTNHFIRYCDQAAAMMLAALRSGKATLPELSPSDTKLYQGIVRVRPKNRVMDSGATQP